MGLLGQCQVSGKRNRTVSIRSLGSSWSTKEKRIYYLLWVSSPCTIILIHLCTAVLSQVVHIYKLDKNKKPSDISYRQLGGAREMTGVWDIIDRSILNSRLAVQRNWIKQICAKPVDTDQDTRAQADSCAGISTSVEPIRNQPIIAKTLLSKIFNVLYLIHVVNVTNDLTQKRY